MTVNSSSSSIVAALAVSVAAAAGLSACSSGPPAAQAAPTSSAPAPAAPASAAPATPAAAGAGASAASGTSGSGGSPAWHAVHDLLASRHLAHLDRCSALHVHAGTPGFAKYLRFGRPSQPWKLGQRHDDRRVAGLAGKATLQLPLVESQATTATALSFSLYAPNKRTLAAKLNGQKLPATKLAPGWQVVTVPVAAPAAFAAGENRLDLDVGGGKPVLVEWLRAGDPAPADAPAAPPVDGAGATLGGCDILTWYAFVPENARLDASITDARCGLTASVAPLGGRPLTAAGEGTVNLALKPLAGQVVRVSLAAGCPRTTLRHAALSVPGAAPAPAAYPKRPKNVVFWIMDTLRYDRVPLWYPGAIAEVPNMEKLAQSGAVFLNFYPGGNESLVSHASMFSSYRPSVHRIVAREGWGHRFAEGTVTLGRALREAGRHAVGVTANGHISGGGFSWGFHAYDNPMAAGKKEKDNGYPANRIVDRALELIEKKKDQPFFLYIGTIDTHVPWRAYEPWVSKYDASNPQPYKGPFKKVATGGGINVSFMLSRKPVAPRDQTRLAAIYASDVSFQDQELGRVVDQLAAWGVLDDTMIIIAADHGEEFWEHGIAGHGGSLREVVVHTPLLVWYPPLFPRGTIAEGVEGIDLLPTILDAIGAPLAPDMQGASLVPLAQGVGRGYPRLAIASHWEAANAARLDRWKLTAENDGDSRLHDVVGDPEERTELTEQRPFERRWVIDAYSTARVFEKHWKKSTWGTAGAMTEQAARELDKL